VKPRRPHGRCRDSRPPGRASGAPGRPWGRSRPLNPRPGRGRGMPAATCGPSPTSPPSGPARAAALSGAGPPRAGGWLRRERRRERRGWEAAGSRFWGSVSSAAEAGSRSWGPRLKAGEPARTGMPSTPRACRVEVTPAWTLVTCPSRPTPFQPLPVFPPLLSCESPTLRLIFKDFKVGNLLGKGSFAGVYRAESIHTGLEVAIKMVRIR
jgi:hypothetical protein